VLTSKRRGEFLRELVSHLADHGPLHRKDLFAHLDQKLAPTDVERALVTNTGKEDWAVQIDWTTTGLVKAGWITKDRGTWAATDTGRAALDQFPDPVEFFNAEEDAYRRWTKVQQKPTRRAWLIRGSSVLGMNLVPDWLADGYCSIAASQLAELSADVDVDTLKKQAEHDYAHLKYHEQKAKVDEIVSFVTRISEGDLVVTTADAGVYLGDVTGIWEYHESEGGRSNLRRTAEWRNAEAPLDLDQLPAPLPSRLQSGHTVVDLTSDLATIDALTGVSDEDDSAAPSDPLLATRHKELTVPPPQFADGLLVDHAWVDEVVDLLNERRQLIFYGPPGTGKTFLARKLANELVGLEQVKLVQFHPAYTYEDFFEGYRPVPGRGDGTLAFELKAGPLRQIVDRAGEHPDQAFILIIDEINRANLAKVFGELYFLLEYRDQAVDLLYSADDEGFTLPTNLYLIGTMNTADRSIALIDSAMRRRFAFLPLDPGSEPTRSLLTRWLDREHLPPTAARLLDLLNDRITDANFRVGPSYFMKNTDHSSARLERVWRTSILPLLEEHHYGEWDEVADNYRFATLLALAEEPTTSEPWTVEP
jgi:5-methylcytosine-specific restriction protein B